MHYFQFEIKEWVANTAHLSLEEEAAYLRLICYYYDSERALPHDDLALIFRKCRVSEELGKGIMLEFFEMDGTLGAWIHKRCDLEIGRYKAKQHQASKAGKASAQRRLNLRSTDVQPIINHKSIIKESISRRGTRLDQDWSLPKEWEIWAQAERPDLNAQKVSESFKDYWIAKAGQAGVKLNWQATWRNWVRSQKQAYIAPQDIARVTTPTPANHDAALKKIEEDRKRAVPIPEEIKKRIELLKRQA